MLASIFSAMWLAAPTAEADEVRIVGAAKVVDGDTLAIGPLRIRLNGIDAPEMGQTCKRGDGRNWDCANAAALRLERLVGEGEITCIALDRDAYGRIVARCEQSTCGPRQKV